MILIECSDNYTFKLAASVLKSLDAPLLMIPLVIPHDVKTIAPQFMITAKDCSQINELLWVQVVPRVLVAIKAGKWIRGHWQVVGGGDDVAIA
mmetsp:Transcript_2981/g.5698  ORF Transcript_2981/g.5698 Transcript_2981/m.5698 type:complete len:93 (-) Transcript_2981:365-643(-)